MAPIFPITPGLEECERFNDEHKCVGVFTEITIEAPPSVVRSKFVDFQARESWDPFVRKIEVAKGSIDLDNSSNEETVIQPELTIALDMKMDGNPQTLPMNATVSQNDSESLVWGVNVAPCGFGLLQLDHVHLFLPGENENENNDNNDATMTRFVNYERFGGTLGRYLAPNLEDLKKGYEAVNEALKKVCEQEK